MPANANLITELAALQREAEPAYAALKRSSDVIRKLAAKTYIWWRRAWETEGFLPSQFEAYGVQGHPDRDGKINFRPVLRLVFRLAKPDKSDEVTLTHWSKAMRSIHAYYELKGAAYFANKPVEKLTAYTKEAGGIIGLAALDNNDDDDGDDGSKRRGRPRGRPKPNPGDPEPRRDFRPQLIQRLDDWGNRSATEHRGLVVMLAYMQDGGFGAYGCIRADEHVAAVATAIAIRDRPLMPPLLRGIVDTVETQAMPADALPPDADKQRKYFERRYGLHGSNKTEKVVLLSPNWVHMTGTRKACVVSSYAPRAGNPIEQPLRLSSADAIKIESWLDSELVAGIWSSPGEVLEPDDIDAGGYQLAFQNARTNRTEFLRLVKAEQKFVAFQQNVFKPAWKAEVDAEWLRSLAEQWAEPWFGVGGRYIGRDDHKVLSLSACADTLSILFDGMYATEDFPWLARSNGGGQWGTLATRYASADLAPVLYRLSQTRTEGAVLSGNEHALVIEYATKGGSFRIAVPTLDASGKPDVTLFGVVAA